jgi:redox-sensitive bicupin YhaK (pirin superfamily)
MPDTADVTPGYAQKMFPERDKRGIFCLVASREGRDGSLALMQDVDISVALIDAAERANYTLDSKRALWLHIARGEVQMNGKALQAGDGVSVYGDADIAFTEGKNAEIILFDMKVV